MRVQLSVRRASAWLASTSTGDGFLALVTSATASHVVYGNLEAPVDATKRYATVHIKYKDTRHAVDVAVDAPIAVALFAVAETDQRKPRIAFVGETTLRLGPKDLTAVADAHDVVFRSPLDGERGVVEMALQRAIEKETESETVGFSVQWTSSEALERDLAAKERAQQANDKKLIERLVVVAANARRAMALRTEALELIRRRHAALVIQHAYKSVRRRRREQRREVRRAAEAVERQKKDAIRAKVAERNRLRTQRLVAQWTTDRLDPVREVPSADQGELATWIETQRAVTQSKLHATLARLEAERAAKLQALALEVAPEPDDRHETRFLSDELIDAIQRLHVKQ